MKTIVGIIAIVVFCLFCLGWGKNIYKLTQCDFEPSYKAEVFRIIGIIPPVGAVMGYIDIEDGVKEDAKN